MGCLEWLLAGQRNVPSTNGCAAGGWGWTNRADAEPNADDTAGAVGAVAMGEGRNGTGAGATRAAAAEGVAWLLEHQNADGGWPMPGRGWDIAAIEPSAPDATAHAVRALNHWCNALAASTPPARRPSEPRFVE